MPRPKSSTIAIQPAQGKRKTFDEDESDEEDFPVAGPSRVADGDDWEDVSDEDDEDDDDAPEAVSVGAAKKGLASREAEIASTTKSKREAAAARSKAIADAKAAARSSEKSKSVNKPNPAGTKRKAKAADDGADEDGAEAKRLRKRMEAAMAAGDGDSEDEDGEGGSGSELDGESGDEASFHTDSDEEEREEDESDAESNSSETLKDGPISDKERTMRAQMQAMMEAAEARSGVAVPAKAKKAEAGEGKAVKSALKKGKRPVEEVGEEENFDLAPLSGFGKPLSAKVLRAAVEEEESRKVRQAEADRVAKEKAREMKQDRKKRRKVDERATVKQLSNGKHLQLLEPELPTGGAGLPPIMPARSTKPAGVQSRGNFFKTAMKTSGMVPGKALGDGRKRPVAS